MKIKVKYNRENGKILGYYPEYILYEKIDLIKKTIDDFPYIEIEQNEQNTDEEMVVINSVYQIFKKSNEEILKDAKVQKINDLNNFHSSPAVKQLTIKAGNLEAHIGLDSDSRYLLDEQIALLKFRIDLKEVNPTWTYQNGVSVPLNLSQLIGLRLYIGSLTDYNYKARREAERMINSLKTLDEIKNFDFKKNYKINQIIPLAL